MRFSAHGAFLEGEMVSEAECGELLRQRALLGAEAICSQEFPPAEYVSFLPEWKQCKGRVGRGKAGGRNCRQQGRMGQKLALIDSACLDLSHAIASLLFALSGGYSMLPRFNLVAREPYIHPLGC